MIIIIVNHMSSNEISIQLYTYTQIGKNPVHVHVHVHLHVCQLHLPGHFTMLIHMHARLLL